MKIKLLLGNINPLMVVDIVSLDKPTAEGFQTRVHLQDGRNWLTTDPQPKVISEFQECLHSCLHPEPVQPSTVQLNLPESSTGMVSLEDIRLLKKWAELDTGYIRSKQRAALSRVLKVIGS